MAEELSPWCPTLILKNKGAKPKQPHCKYSRKFAMISRPDRSLPMGMSALAAASPKAGNASTGPEGDGERRPPMLVAAAVEEAAGWACSSPP